MKINSRLLLTATAALSGAVAFSSCGMGGGSSTPELENPNLLYIFPDQHRLMALGLWSNPEYREALNTVGDPVHTPNLDKLAQSGVVFSDVCSMFPLSSPHRGMMMSGMYSTRNGLDSNAHKTRTCGLRHDIECFTDVLADAGYETAYVGKTHWERNEALFDENENYVGTTEAPGGHTMNPYDTYIPEGPGRHSNEFWFQHVKDNHFHPASYSNIPEFVGGKSDGEQHMANRFSVTAEADIVISYLNNGGGRYRDADAPFSMIWSINPPHNPYSKITDCEAEEFARFANMPIEQLLPRENVAFKDAADKARLELTSKVYFSLISSVDREIGRVLEALEKNNLTDNTMIVFTSDHGEMMGSHAKMGKPQIFDEAFRVPFIISYPGVLEHRIENLPLSSVDIMPTLLGLMGLSDNIPATVDGRDYTTGLLTGDYGTFGKPTSSLYRDFHNKGVRNEKYTYLVLPDGTYSLYDTAADPYQLNSLKLEDIPAEDAAELKSELGFWLKDAGDAWVAQKKNSDLITY